jgi:hypothetical protein
MRYSTENNMFATISFAVILKPPIPALFKELLQLVDQLHLCEGRAQMDKKKASPYQGSVLRNSFLIINSSHFLLLYVFISVGSSRTTVRNVHFFI